MPTRKLSAMPMSPPYPPLRTIDSNAVGTEAVYRVADGRAHASANAAGPWDPLLQHGAAPAALVAWAAERIEAPAPMRVARLTLDLLRPVPLGPLEVRTELVRQGRKLQRASVSLLANGVEVVHASVLKVRSAEIPIPNGVGEEPLDQPGPERALAPSEATDIPSAFLDGMSMRVAAGVSGRGRSAIWFRADRALIDGEPTTPLMRAAVAADFCNGASAVLDPRDWTFVNGDLSLSLARMPVGEWILLDAQTWIGTDAGGIAFGRMADAAGYFGRAVQSLVVERRPQHAEAA